MLPLRLAGLLLVLGTVVPLHRLLDPARAGPAGRATRAAAEAAWMTGLSGALIVVLLAWVAARMLPNRDPARPDLVERAAARIELVPARAFAGLCGLLVLAETAWIARVVHGAGPVTVDEMAQLLHATALMGGSLTVDGPAPAASWIVQNGVLTDGGAWVSIYPPLHTLLLAAGLAVGGAWLVGPVMTGLATACVCRGLERCVGPGPARATGLLLCVAPFWLLIGATHLSHTTAAAGLALLFLGLTFAIPPAAGESRAEGAVDPSTSGEDQRGLGWAALAGAGAGVAVSARPWVGLTCGLGLGIAVWGTRMYADWRTRSAAPATWGPRLSALVGGGLPFALLLFWWNARLFGSPLRLGYTAAFGPAHGLGLHRDPWGNVYGPVEMLAYTGADIVQLGVRLLETPLPVTLLVGGALLLGLLRGPGVRILGAWAVAGLGASALYWHHGLLFGPRLLFEMAPALSGLCALVFVRVWRAPGGTTGAFGRWVVGTSLVAGVSLAATGIAGARGGPGAAVPDLPSGLESGATVFVHGSWASRVSARLVAAGMRRDSVETALRRNGLCAVDRYARWRGAGSGPPPALDLVPLPGSPGTLRTVELAPGNLARLDPAQPPDPQCMREMRADRLGGLELEPVAWKAAAEGGVTLLRDLGPGMNLRAVGGGGTGAWVWIVRDEAAPLLLPYAEGMQLLWGGPGG